MLLILDGKSRSTMQTRESTAQSKLSTLLRSIACAKDPKHVRLIKYRRAFLPEHHNCPSFHTRRNRHSKVKSPEIEARHQIISLHFDSTKNKILPFSVNYLQQFLALPL
jgi:hypothetical protein